MSKWGVLTLWLPYETFDTKQEAQAYRQALDMSNIGSFLVEINE